MGCKQSDLRDDGAIINPANLPPVPTDCWYALPFTETSPMPQTDFHTANKGKVLFSPLCIPTRAAEINSLPNKEPPLQFAFVVGEDNIYGMGYLHNTALFIEHHWRTRVEHNPPRNKFERPFYDCLIGIQVYINDVLVPDCAPHNESLVQCTTTYRAPEAVTLWRAVPIVLIGDPSHFTLSQVHLYRGLSLSFLTAVETLNVGEHDVRVEVVYGCKSEANFCTQFIARGACTIIVTDESRAKVRQLRSVVDRLIDDNPPRVLKGPATEGCLYCRHPLQYTCTICAARICGTPNCVWSAYIGYPFGCTSHGTVTADETA